MVSPPALSVCNPNPNLSATSPELPRLGERPRAYSSQPRHWHLPRYVALTPDSTVSSRRTYRRGGSAVSGRSASSPPADAQDQRQRFRHLQTCRPAGVTQGYFRPAEKAVSISEGVIRGLRLTPDRQTQPNGRHARSHQAVDWRRQALCQLGSAPWRRTPGLSRSSEPANSFRFAGSDSMRRRSRGAQPTSRRRLPPFRTHRGRAPNASACSSSGPRPLWGVTTRCWHRLSGTFPELL